MKIKLKKYKTVKSTNDVAIKLIKKNVVDPTLIISNKQTEGRGRVGKKWNSIEGNLFMTIFFKLDQNKINFKQFAVLNAFLLRKLISKNTSKNIMIKWPNDLLYQGLKFCGILQEVIKFNQFDYLLIGIGLNTNIAPKNKNFKSTCLKNITNKRVDNQKIVKNILTVYEKFLNQTQRMSFSEIRRKYK